ncbi:MAG: multicopper oxidase domain-containing protein [Alphaproteobacteria bacterium]|nr:multicopper oxidase domain-containing protein [Alphaproteobacteria bacterium]
MRAANHSTVIHFAIRRSRGDFLFPSFCRHRIHHAFAPRISRKLCCLYCLIHWHGLTPPSDQDGVPGISGPPIQPDLNDVKYDAFLANERTLMDPQVVQIKKGGRVLLRIINSAVMTNFHIDLGDTEATLVAGDGQDMAPISGKRFPIAVAQRLDPLVQAPQS